MKIFFTLLACSILFVNGYSQYPAPVEEIFRVVEEMPRFPGCEDEKYSSQEKYNCADKNLREFIYQNINYPETAKRDSLEGTVIVQFVVEKDGSLSNIKIVKELGNGFDEEVLRIMDLMPLWLPGTQRKRPVKVLYTLPVKFNLDNIKK